MVPRLKIILAIKVLLPVLIILLLNINPSPIFLKIANQPVQKTGSSGNFSDSQSYLEKIVSLEPWRADIWEQIGNGELTARNPALAVNAFQKAGNSGGLSPQGTLALGTAFVQLKEEQNAIQTWETLTRNPQYLFQAYTQIVQTYRDNGEFTAEAGTLRSWLKIQPQNPQNILRLGLILSTSDGGEAGNLLTQAAALDPSLSGKVNIIKKALVTTSAAQPTGYDQVITGRALGDIGEWALAASAFKSATILNPNYAEGWAFLGEAKQQLGQDGYPELKHAESLNPDSVIAKSLLSIYWEKQGDPGTALAYLYAVSELEPTEPAWQIQLGTLLAETGNNTMALYHFQKAVDLEPSSAVTWQSLANFCINNDIELSSIGLPAARQAVTLAPDDPQNITTMGSALIATGDLVNGEKFLTRALQIDNKFVEANIQLGLLYNQLDKRDAAFYYINKAVLYSSNDSPQGIMARRLLKVYFGIDN
jgi:tetratricopeptide (TPR) repeat protein